MACHPPFPLSSSPCTLREPPSPVLRRHSSPVLAVPKKGGGGPEGSGKRGVEREEPTYDYSDPVNGFLGQFLPPARDVEAELAHLQWDAPKVEGLPLEALAQRLEAGLTEKEWFVTGDIDLAVFSDSFSFKDDSVAIASSPDPSSSSSSTGGKGGGGGGLRTYALGVRKLFDQETSRAEIIAVEARPHSERGAKLAGGGADADAGKAGCPAGGQVVVTWWLEGRVNLPLRPRIPPYVVTTTFSVDERGLVASQLDEFSVPGWRILAGALLGAWAGPPPAPPAEQLRKEYQAAAARSKG